MKNHLQEIRKKISRLHKNPAFTVERVVVSPRFFDDYIDHQIKSSEVNYTNTRKKIFGEDLEVEYSTRDYRVEKTAKNEFCTDCESQKIYDETRNEYYCPICD
jgi:hypothetical protein